MKQHRRTWQRHEQHIAEALRTARNGITGNVGADVLTDSWAIECKSWRQLPARVEDALRQAEQSAAGTHRTPVAVIHKVGDRRDRDLVILRWRDFADLLLGEHDDDRTTARRVATAVQLADATAKERAILAPDLAELLAGDDTDETIRRLLADDSTSND